MLNLGLIATSLLPFALYSWLTSSVAVEASWESIDYVSYIQYSIQSSVGRHFRTDLVHWLRLRLRLRLPIFLLIKLIPIIICKNIE